MPDATERRPESGRSRYRLEDVLFDPAERTLAKDGQIVALPPKTFDLLSFLIERPGALVEKQELLDALWADVFVTENALTRSVKELRRALGDDARAPRFVETVPRVGYRLIAEVERLDTISEAGSPDGASPEVGSDRSVRVRRRSWLGLAAAAAIALTILLFLGPGFLRRDASGPMPPLARTAETLLSTFPGSHVEPTLSTDGARVVFVDEAAGGRQLWVAPTAGGPPTQLTFLDHPTVRPRWSPVADEILFTVWQGPNPSLWLAQVDGVPPRRLLEGAANGSWSRDGEQIVFERGNTIWTASRTGSHQRRVEGLPAVDLLLAPRLPAFSPDGRWIAYFETSGGPLGDLFVIPSGGGEPRQVTFDDAQAAGPQWSPDGDWLLFSSRRTGSGNLWQVPVTGGVPVPLTKGGGEHRDVTLSFDGTTAVYASSRRRFSLVISDPVAGSERILTEHGQELVDPEFSPDGERLVVFGLDENGVQLYRIERAGGDLAPITSERAVRSIHPQWSFDGRSVFAYQAGAVVGLARVELETGHSELLVPGWSWPRENQGHVDARGARALYSRLDRGQVVATMVHELETGQERALATLLRGPRWSPDGTRIAGILETAGPASREIAVCLEDGSQCRSLASGDWVRWSRDARRLYFLRPGASANHWRLFSVELSSGAEAELAELGPMHPIGPFYDVGASGEIVWVRYQRDRSELWLLRALDE